MARRFEDLGAGDSEESMDGSSAVDFGARDLEREGGADFFMAEELEGILGSTAKRLVMVHVPWRGFTSVAWLRVLL